MLRRFMMSGLRSISTANRLKGFDSPTVWSEFTPLANKHQAVNLGQGFPDWATPDFAKQALVEAIHSDANQYSRSGGDLELVKALSEHYSPLINRKLDPLTEITVGVGATEVLFAIMQALINEGDEVVTLEPTFDIYSAAVQMANGKLVSVPLELDASTKQWKLDMNLLASKLTPNTKIFLLNTPHNPTGKVFTKEELQQIAQIVVQFPQLTVVTDEVYEKLVYDHHEHVRFAGVTIPSTTDSENSVESMFDRTLTISSCGKTFSCTGWKVGWVYGPEPLVKAVMLANQWIQYCVSTPTQRALAKILKQAESEPYEGFPNYYEYIRNVYQNKRNRVVQYLQDSKFDVSIPEGGFFIMADTSNFAVPQSFIEQPYLTGEHPVSRDWAFARWLTSEKGITPIPPSAFYTAATKDKASNLARFAFCKTDALLDEAEKRFQQLASDDSNYTNVN